MSPDRPFLDALKAFAADPLDADARRAVGVERFRFMENPSRIDEFRWPAAMRTALCLGDAIMDVKIGSPRSVALSEIAGALAEAILGDVGDIRAPSTPPVPARQYRDD